MHHLLSRILERVYFLFLTTSDSENEINIADDNSLTKDIFSFWESQSYTVLKKEYRTIAYNRFTIFLERNCPTSMQLDAIEFLGLHFSKANMKAFLADITEIGNLNGIDLNEYNEFINLFYPVWEITSEELELISSDRRLRSGHFCQSFRLNREIVLSELLGKTFQLDSLIPLIKPLERENVTASLFENMSSNHLIGQALIPRLDRLLSEVCKTLEVSEPFDIFVSNQPVQGAWIMAMMSSSEKNYITITSELVMKLSDDELKFVIGHEIGHWLFNINDISSLLNACYDEEDNVPSISLQNLLATWKKLAEFSADRVGIVACGSLEVAIESLYRVSTGLDPQRMEFRGKDYLNNLDSELPNKLDLKFFRDDIHPPLPIRMKALALFGNSKLYQCWKQDKELIFEDTNLSEQMGELIRLLDFTSENPLHNRRLLAITLGGFILAGVDEEIHQDEIEQIKEVLYRFVLNADFIISYVVKLIEDGADLFPMLEDALVDLIVADEEEKYNLMNVFIEVALSDGVLKSEETELLLQIGSFLKIDRENILRVIARFLGRGFFFEKQVPDSIFDLLERKHPFHSGNLDERIELANNQKADPSELNQLASDADPFVRRLVLFNESTPEKTRMELLDSPSLMREIHEEMDDNDPED